MMIHPFTGALPDSSIATAGLYPLQQLSTATVPEVERFSYWLDVICSLFVQLECDPPTKGAICGAVESGSLGTLDFTHLRSNAGHVSRTEERIRKDGEDFCLALIQCEGRGALSQGSRTAPLGPGDFVLTDCTRPYDFNFEEPFHDVYVIRLPRKALTAHVGNVEDLCATTVPGASAAGHLLLNMIDTLRRDFHVLHPASVNGVSEAIISVIGAGLRSLPGANERKRSNLSAYHLARIRAHILQHLQDPQLSVATVAQAMNLSGDHVCRLFKKEPLAPSKFIWQERLKACRRDLADPRMAAKSVSDIAFSWGFNGAAHFSRSFKESFGASPTEWRYDQLSTRIARRH